MTSFRHVRFTARVLNPFVLLFCATIAPSYAGSLSRPFYFTIALLWLLSRSINQTYRNKHELRDVNSNFNVPPRLRFFLFIYLLQIGVSICCLTVSTVSNFLFFDVEPDKIPYWIEALGFHIIDKDNSPILQIIDLCFIDLTVLFVSCIGLFLTKSFIKQMDESTLVYSALQNHDPTSLAENESAIDDVPLNHPLFSISSSKTWMFPVIPLVCALSVALHPGISAIPCLAYILFHIARMFTPYMLPNYVKKNKVITIPQNLMMRRSTAHSIGLNQSLHPPESTSTHTNQWNTRHRSSESHSNINVYLDSASEQIDLPTFFSSVESSSQPLIYTASPYRLKALKALYACLFPIIVLQYFFGFVPFIPDVMASIAMPLGLPFYVPPFAFRVDSPTRQMPLKDANWDCLTFYTLNQFVIHLLIFACLSWWLPQQAHYRAEKQQLIDYEQQILQIQQHHQQQQQLGMRKSLFPQTNTHHNNENIIDHEDNTIRSPFSLRGAAQRAPSVASLPPPLNIPSSQSLYLHSARSNENTDKNVKHTNVKSGDPELPSLSPEEGTKIPWRKLFSFLLQLAPHMRFIKKIVSHWMNSLSTLWCLIALGFLSIAFPSIATLPAFMTCLSLSLINDPFSSSNNLVAPTNSSTQNQHDSSSNSTSHNSNNNNNNNSNNDNTNPLTNTGQQSNAPTMKPHLLFRYSPLILCNIVIIILSLILNLIANVPGVGFNFGIVKSAAFMPNAYNSSAAKFGIWRLTCPPANVTTSTSPGPTRTLLIFSHFIVLFVVCVSWTSANPVTSNSRSNDTFDEEGQSNDDSHRHNPHSMTSPLVLRPSQLASSGNQHIRMSDTLPSLQKNPNGGRIYSSNSFSPSRFDSPELNPAKNYPKLQSTLNPSVHPEHTVKIGGNASVNGVLSTGNVNITTQNAFHSLRGEDKSPRVLIDENTSTFNLNNLNISTKNNSVRKENVEARTAAFNEQLAAHAIYSSSSDSVSSVGPRVQALVHYFRNENEEEENGSSIDEYTLFQDLEINSNEIVLDHPWFSSLGGNKNHEQNKRSRNKMLKKDFNIDHVQLLRSSGFFNHSSEDVSTPPNIYENINITQKMSSSLPENEILTPGNISSNMLSSSSDSAALNQGSNKFFASDIITAVISGKETDYNSNKNTVNENSQVPNAFMTASQLSNIHDNAININSNASHCENGSDTESKKNITNYFKSAHHSSSQARDEEEEVGKAAFRNWVLSNEPVVQSAPFSPVDDSDTVKQDFKSLSSSYSVSEALSSSSPDDVAEELKHDSFSNSVLDKLEDHHVKSGGEEEKDNIEINGRFKRRIRNSQESSVDDKSYLVNSDDELNRDYADESEYNFIDKEDYEEDYEEEEDPISMILNKLTVPEWLRDFAHRLIDYLHNAFMFLVTSSDRIILLFILFLVFPISDMLFSSKGSETDEFINPLTYEEMKATHQPMPGVSQFPTSVFKSLYLIFYLIMICIPPEHRFSSHSTKNRSNNNQGGANARSILQSPVIFAWRCIMFYSVLFCVCIFVNHILNNEDVPLAGFTRSTYFHLTFPLLLPLLIFVCCKVQMLLHYSVWLEEKVSTWYKNRRLAAYAVAETALPQRRDIDPLPVINDAELLLEKVSRPYSLFRFRSYHSWFLWWVLILNAYCVYAKPHALDSFFLLGALISILFCIQRPTPERYWTILAVLALLTGIVLLVRYLSQLDIFYKVIENSYRIAITRECELDDYNISFSISKPWQIFSLGQIKPLTTFEAVNAIIYPLNSKFPYYDYSSLNLCTPLLFTPVELGLPLTNGAIFKLFAEAVLCWCFAILAHRGRDTVRKIRRLEQLIDVRKQFQAALAVASSKQFSPEFYIRLNQITHSSRENNVLSNVGNNSNKNNIKNNNTIDQQLKDLKNENYFKSQTAASSANFIEKHLQSSSNRVSSPSLNPSVIDLNGRETSKKSMLFSSRVDSKGPLKSPEFTVPNRPTLSKSQKRQSPAVSAGDSLSPLRIFIPEGESSHLSSPFLLPSPSRAFSGLLLPDAESSESLFINNSPSSTYHNGNLSRNTTAISKKFMLDSMKDETPQIPPTVDNNSLFRSPATSPDFSTLPQPIRGWEKMAWRIEHYKLSIKHYKMSLTNYLMKMEHASIVDPLIDQPPLLPPACLRLVYPSIEFPTLMKFIRALEWIRVKLSIRKDRHARDVKMITASREGHILPFMNDRKSFKSIRSSVNSSYSKKNIYSPLEGDKTPKSETGEKDNLTSFSLNIENKSSNLLKLKSPNEDGFSKVKMNAFDLSSSDDGLFKQKPSANTNPSKVSQGIESKSFFDRNITSCNRDYSAYLNTDDSSLKKLPQSLFDPSLKLSSPIKHNSKKKIKRDKFSYRPRSSLSSDDNSDDSIQVNPSKTSPDVFECSSSDDISSETSECSSAEGSFSRKEDSENQILNIDHLHARIARLLATVYNRPVRPIPSLASLQHKMSSESVADCLFSPVDISPSLLIHPSTAPMAPPSTLLQPKSAQKDEGIYDQHLRKPSELSSLEQTSLLRQRSGISQNLSCSLPNKEAVGTTHHTLSSASILVAALKVDHQARKDMDLFFDWRSRLIGFWALMVRLVCLHHPKVLLIVCCLILFNLNILSIIFMASTGLVMVLTFSSFRAVALLCKLTLLALPVQYAVSFIKPGISIGCGNLVWSGLLWSNSHCRHPLTVSLIITFLFLWSTSCIRWGLSRGYITSEEVDKLIKVINNSTQSPKNNVNVTDETVNGDEISTNTSQSISQSLNVSPVIAPVDSLPYSISEKPILNSIKEEPSKFLSGLRTFSALKKTRRERFAVDFPDLESSKPIHPDDGSNAFNAQNRLSTKSSEMYKSGFYSSAKYSLHTSARKLSKQLGLSAGLSSYKDEICCLICMLCAINWAGTIGLSSLIVCAVVFRSRPIILGVILISGVVISSILKAGLNFSNDSHYSTIFEKIMSKVMPDDTVISEFIPNSSYDIFPSLLSEKTCSIMFNAVGNTDYSDICISEMRAYFDAVPDALSNDCSTRLSSLTTGKDIVQMPSDCLSILSDEILLSFTNTPTASASPATKSASSISTAEDKSVLSIAAATVDAASVTSNQSVNLASVTISQFTASIQVSNFNLTKLGFRQRWMLVTGLILIMMSTVKRRTKEDIVLDDSIPKKKRFNLFNSEDKRRSKVTNPNAEKDSDVRPLLQFPGKDASVSSFTSFSEATSKDQQSNVKLGSRYKLRRNGQSSKDFLKSSTPVASEKKMKIEEVNKNNKDEEIKKYVIKKHPKMITSFKLITNLPSHTTHVDLYTTKNRTLKSDILSALCTALIIIAACLSVGINSLVFFSIAAARIIFSFKNRIAAIEKSQLQQSDKNEANNLNHHETTDHEIRDVRDIQILSDNKSNNPNGGNDESTAMTQTLHGSFLHYRPLDDTTPPIVSFDEHPHRHMPSHNHARSFSSQSVNRHRNFENWDSKSNHLQSGNFKQLTTPKSNHERCFSTELSSCEVDSEDKNPPFHSIHGNKHSELVVTPSIASGGPSNLIPTAGNEQQVKHEPKLKLSALSMDNDSQRNSSQLSLLSQYSVKTLRDKISSSALLCAVPFGFSRQRRLTLRVCMYVTLAVCFFQLIWSRWPGSPCIFEPSRVVEAQRFANSLAAGTQPSNTSVFNKDVPFIPYRVCADWSQDPNTRRFYESWGLNYWITIPTLLGIGKGSNVPPPFVIIFLMIALVFEIRMIDQHPFDIISSPNLRAARLGRFIELDMMRSALQTLRNVCTRASLMEKLERVRAVLDIKQRQWHEELPMPSTEENYTISLSEARVKAIEQVGEQGFSPLLSAIALQASCWDIPIAIQCLNLMISVHLREIHLLSFKQQIDLLLAGAKSAAESKELVLMGKSPVNHSVPISPSNILNGKTVFKRSNDFKVDNKSSIINSNQKSVGAKPQSVSEDFMPTLLAAPLIAPKAGLAPLLLPGTPVIGSLVPSVSAVTDWIMSNRPLDAAGRRHTLLTATTAASDALEAITNIKLALSGGGNIEFFSPMIAELAITIVFTLPLIEGLPSIDIKEALDRNSDLFIACSRDPVVCIYRFACHSWRERSLNNLSSLTDNAESKTDLVLKENHRVPKLKYGNAHGQTSLGGDAWNEALVSISSLGLWEAAFIRSPNEPLGAHKLENTSFIVPMLKWIYSRSFVWVCMSAVLTFVNSVSVFSFVPVFILFAFIIPSPGLAPRSVWLFLMGFHLVFFLLKILYQLPLFCSGFTDEPCSVVMIPSIWNILGFYKIFGRQAITQTNGFIAFGIDVLYMGCLLFHISLLQRTGIWSVANPSRLVFKGSPGVDHPLHPNNRLSSNNNSNHHNNNNPKNQYHSNIDIPASNDKIVQPKTINEFFSSSHASPLVRNQFSLSRQKSDSTVSHLNYERDPPLANTIGRPVRSSVSLTPFDYTLGKNTSASPGISTSSSKTRSVPKIVRSTSAVNFSPDQLANNNRLSLSSSSMRLMQQVSFQQQSVSLRYNSLQPPATSFRASRSFVVSPPSSIGVGDDPRPFTFDEHPTAAAKSSSFNHIDGLGSCDDTKHIHENSGDRIHIFIPPPPLSSSLGSPLNAANAQRGIHSSGADSRPGTDLYPLIFLVSFLSFFTLLFGFSDIFGGTEDITTSIMRNRLSLSFLLGVVIHIGLLITDRIVYRFTFRPGPNLSSSILNATTDKHVKFDKSHQHTNSKSPKNYFPHRMSAASVIPSLIRNPSASLVHPDVHKSGFRPELSTPLFNYPEFISSSQRPANSPTQNINAINSMTPTFRVQEEGGAHLRRNYSNNNANNNGEESEVSNLLVPSLNDGYNSGESPTINNVNNNKRRNSNKQSCGLKIKSFLQTVYYAPKHEKAVWTRVFLLVLELIGLHLIFILQLVYSKYTPSKASNTSTYSDASNSSTARSAVIGTANVFVPTMDTTSMWYRPAVLIYYILIMTYLALSACQNALGLPIAIVSHPLTCTIRMPRYLFFKIYRLIPFLEEIRILIDHACSKTSMDFFMWFKLEDAFYILHTVRRDMWTRSLYYPGQKRKRCELCISGLMVLGIMALVVGPLMFFSDLLALSVNPVETVSMEIQLIARPHILNDYSPVGPSYFSLIPEHLTTNVAYFSTGDEIRFLNSLSKVVAESGVRDSKAFIVCFNGASDYLWSPAPPLQTSMVNILKNTFDASTKRTDGDTLYYNVEMHTKYIISTKYATDRLATDIIVLSDSHREKMATAIEKLSKSIVDGSDNDDERVLLTIDLNPGLSDIWVLSSTNLGSALKGGSSKTKADLTLKAKSRFNELNGVRSVVGEDLWWSLASKSDDDLFPKPKCNGGGSNGIDNLFDLTVVSPRTYIINNSNDSSSTSSLTLIGVFVGVVYALSRAIRSACDFFSTRVIYEEVNNVDMLLDICNGIYLARLQADCKLEYELYFTLIHVYRRPELLLFLTGQRIPGQLTEAQWSIHQRLKQEHRRLKQKEKERHKHVLKMITSNPESAVNDSNPKNSVKARSPLINSQKHIATEENRNFNSQLFSPRSVTADRVVGRNISNRLLTPPEFDSLTEEESVDH